MGNVLIKEALMHQFNMPQDIADIIVHQHSFHFQLMKELMDYHQYKRIYRSKRACYCMLCRNCGTRIIEYGDPNCNCGDYSPPQWCSQGEIIWMFIRNLPITKR